MHGSCSVVTPDTFEDDEYDASNEDTIDIFWCGGCYKRSGLFESLVMLLLCIKPVLSRGLTIGR
jgi:hypothetical protein